MNPLVATAAMQAVNTQEFRQTASSTVNTAANTAAFVVKSIVFTGIGIAVFVVGRKMYKTYQESKVGKQYQSAINNMDVNSNNLTIDSNTAKLIANQLYTAMSGTGTDENSIVSLLSNKTKDDLTLIIKSFGVQKYGTFGKPMYSWLPSVDLDLMGWLKKELSGNSLKQVQNIFATAGLTF